MGADIGMVSFNDVSDNLVAVGDAIVWATRMASAGNASEIIINNELFDALKSDAILAFTDRPGITKTGESFLGRAMAFRSEVGD